MTEAIEIQPTGPLVGTVRPPGSKSLTNRALVCAALATGRSTLEGVLDSIDTRVMVDALAKLGIAIEADWQQCRLSVVGCAGVIPVREAQLYVANSGTSARFLAAMLALGHGKYELDGNPRMRERPIQDLLQAIEQLGARARSLAGTGCPPLVIEADGLSGGPATVRGDLSSQFLSGLLMAAPFARNEVDLQVEGPLVSPPYVDMTLAVMSSFGIDVQTFHDAGQIPHRFRIPRGIYRACEYKIEPDASAASYFFAAAAITGGRVTIEGLSRQSLQGDVALVDVLQRMGCEVQWQTDRVTVAGRPLAGIDVEMGAISDTVMTLASVALFAAGPTTITNVAHIRHKETDRIAALVTELRKLGAAVDEFPDGLRIVPGPLHGAAIDTYDDHRMAMGLALAGLRIPGVFINDPGCTAKTYPHFFRDLAALGK